MVSAVMAVDGKFPMRCPICHGPSVAAGKVGETPLLRCIERDCRFRFFDLSVWSPQQRDEDYYEDWVGGGLTVEAPWIQARVAMLRRFKAAGVVADLGCGLGETTIALDRAGFTAIGVDDSSVAVTFLQNNYKGPEWVSSNIKEFLVNRHHDLDAITLFHVLEHIPYPKELIELAMQALRPGSPIVIEVPDVGGGRARVLGVRWEYYLDHHVNYFDLRSLTRLMRPYGYSCKFARRTYHFSYPQGHLLKDIIKGAMAACGYNSIIRTVWA